MKPLARRLCANKPLDAGGAIIRYGDGHASVVAHDAGKRLDEGFARIVPGGCVALVGGEGIEDGFALEQPERLAPCRLFAP